MTSIKRWVVTYTKHMKQKRKIYHDGVLELNASGDKVMLYDDTEKLIDSRFLRKDEVLECGNTLTMDAHLIDIGASDGDRCPPANLKMNHGNKILKESSSKHGEKEKLCIANNKGATHLKPLQKDLNATHSSIRLRKKTEVGRSSEIEIPPHTTDSSVKEWNALYTTQLTQKAKKYHDCILRLAQVGSHAKQIILLNEDGATLGSKYLRSVEHVEIGTKFELPNYLIEVCEPRIQQQDDLQKHPPEKVGSPKITRSIKYTKDLQKFEQDKIATSMGTRMLKLASSKSDSQLRDACQILSIVKKPFPASKCDQRKVPIQKVSSSVSSDSVLIDSESQRETKLDRTGTRNLNLVVDDNSKCQPIGVASQDSTSKSSYIKQEASEDHPLSVVTCLSSGQGRPGSQSLSEAAPGALLSKLDPGSSTPRWPIDAMMAAEPPIGGESTTSSLLNGEERLPDSTSNHLEENHSITGNFYSLSVETATGIWGAYEDKKETTIQICTEDEKGCEQCGRMPSSDASGDSCSSNSEVESLKGCPSAVDDCPTFELGF